MMGEFTRALRVALRVAGMAASGLAVLVSAALMSATLTMDLGLWGFQPRHMQLLSHDRLMHVLLGAIVTMFVVMLAGGGVHTKQRRFLVPALLLCAFVGGLHALFVSRAVTVLRAGHRHHHPHGPHAGPHPDHLRHASPTATAWAAGVEVAPPTAGADLFEASAAEVVAVEDSPSVFVDEHGRFRLTGVPKVRFPALEEMLRRDIRVMARDATCRPAATGGLVVKSAAGDMTVGRGYLCNNLLLAAAADVQLEKLIHKPHTPYRAQQHVDFVQCVRKNSPSSAVAVVECLADAAVADGAQDIVYGMLHFNTYMVFLYIVLIAALLAAHHELNEEERVSATSAAVPQEAEEEAVQSVVVHDGRVAREPLLAREVREAGQAESVRAAAPSAPVAVPSAPVAAAVVWSAPPQSPPADCQFEDEAMYPVV